MCFHYSWMITGLVSVVRYPLLKFSDLILVFVWVSLTHVVVRGGKGEEEGLALGGSPRRITQFRPPKFEESFITQLQTFVVFGFRLVTAFTSVIEVNGRGIENSPTGSCGRINQTHLMRPRHQSNTD